MHRNTSMLRCGLDKEHTGARAPNGVFHIYNVLQICIRLSSFLFLEEETHELFIYTKIFYLFVTKMYYFNI